LDLQDPFVTAPRSEEKRLMRLVTALVAAVALLAACGQDLDDEPFDEPAAEPDAAAPDESGPEADGDPAAAPDAVGECGMPEFTLADLPWEGDPGEPDEIQAREQVTALVWYRPEGEGSLQLLRGQGQPSRVEPHDTVTVRGHEATLWWTGEPGTGPLYAHWVQSDDPCDQYMVVLAPASDVAELVALLPE
jgi:hypothetical protein